MGVAQGVVLGGAVHGVDGRGIVEEGVVLGRVGVEGLH